MSFCWELGLATANIDYCVIEKLGGTAPCECFLSFSGFSCNWTTPTKASRLSMVVFQTEL